MVSDCQKTNVAAKMYFFHFPRLFVHLFCSKFNPFLDDPLFKSDLKLK